MSTRSLLTRSLMAGGLGILLSAAVCRTEDTLQAKTYGWRRTGAQQSGEECSRHLHFISTMT